MTMEDVRKINSECGNNFEFDVQHFLFHKEKELEKSIPLADGKVLKVRLCWTNDHEERKNAYGQTFSVHNGKYVPTVHFSVWAKDGVMWHSYGLGYFVPIGEGVKRRSIKELQQRSRGFNTNICMDMFEEVKKNKVNPMA